MDILKGGKDRIYETLGRKGQVVYPRRFLGDSEIGEVLKDAGWQRCKDGA